MSAVKAAMDDAESGDEAKQAMVAAAFLNAEGRKDEALEALEHGARLGNVDAMLGASDLARELGRDSVARFWTEQAAAAGSSVAMFNLGLQGLQHNDLAQADRWLQESGRAGLAEAYAALIEVAERAGDDHAARRWAETGARLDNPRCLEIHSLNIMRGHEEEPAVVREALGLMERAASQGYAPAMDRCGILHFSTGNRTQAKYWLEQAVQAGDPDAGERLVRYGLV